MREVPRVGGGSGRAGYGDYLTILYSFPSEDGFFGMIDLKLIVFWVGTVAGYQSGGYYIGWC